MLTSSDDHWRQQAACKDMPTGLFFVSRPQPRQALNVCASCPVQEACLATAQAAQEEGVWGGTTDVDRRRLRRAAA